MGYRLAADLTLILHLSFVVFVLFGGLLCLHQIRWRLLHLPAVVWGVWVEWSGWICPLTPLENHFRKLASGQGFQGGFIEHYLLPLLYPNQLTVSLQWSLGFLLLFVNIIIYLYVFRKKQNIEQQLTIEPLTLTFKKHKGEETMSENDCLNPEEHCELHMCQLKATDLKDEINKLYENPKFVCTNCGVKVNSEANLCSPKAI